MAPPLAPPLPSPYSSFVMQLSTVPASSAAALRSGIDAIVTSARASGALTPAQLRRLETHAYLVWMKRIPQARAAEDAYRKAAARRARDTVEAAAARMG